MDREDNEKTRLAMELSTAMAALYTIRDRPDVERNPDSVDQAAATMKLIAGDALRAITEIRASFGYEPFPGTTAPETFG